MAQMKRLFWGLASLFLLSGAVSAQTVSIVSGNGQMTCAFSCGAQGFNDLVVLVTGSGGAPLANATVTWLVAGSGLVAGSLPTTTTQTDANGRSSVPFYQAPNIQAGGAYVQSAVTASAGTSAVIFYETTALTNLLFQNSVTVTMLSPSLGDVFIGQAGTQSGTLIHILIGTVYGGGVPNVDVHLIATDSTTPAANISCATGPGASAGAVLSDATGNVTCTPVFGAALGSGRFNIAVGGQYLVFGSFGDQIDPGLPCTIKIPADGGNNQSGNAGAALPFPLKAEVDDCGGTPLNGVSVVWTVMQGAATLANMRTSTTNGQVSTNVTLGSAPGPTVIQLAVAPGTATSSNQPVTPVTFTVTTNVSISGMTKSGGDGQDAAVNTAFALPLVVQVNNQAQGVAGVTVRWVVTSGTATLSAASSITNTQGQASVTAQAGANPGPVVITATAVAGTQTATQAFNLTVRLPGPSNVTFLNGADFQKDRLAPCGVATITGSGLAPGIQGIVAPTFFGPLPLLVATVTVQFGNSFAPIYSVANQSGQQSVTIQVPCETQPGTVPVIIKVGGGSASFNAQVLPAAPGLFQAPDRSDGKSRAVLLKPDGSFVSVLNPARKGERIRMYVTGLGQTVPAIATNSPGIPDTDSMVDLSTVVVGVNNAGVPVISARYARDLIGGYEVVFQMPNDTPTGNDVPLVIAVTSGSQLVFSAGSSVPVL